MSPLEIEAVASVLLCCSLVELKTLELVEFIPKLHMDKSPCSIIILRAIENCLVLLDCTGQAVL